MVFEFFCAVTVFFPNTGQL